MSIDWFTFGAQIVNFLVLVWLLRKFLYRPIIGAMDAREAAIRERIESADRKQAEADQQADLYREKNSQLEHRQEELMAEIHQTVAKHKSELLHEAREEIEHSRAAWYEALRREQHALAQEIKRDTGVRAIAIARQALNDFADEDLHQRVVAVFRRRLEKLDEKQLSALRTALQADQNQVRGRQRISSGVGRSRDDRNSVAPKTECEFQSHLPSDRRRYLWYRSTRGWSADFMEL